MLNPHLHHLHHYQSVAQIVPDRLQAQRALQWLSRLLTTSPTGRSGWIVFCLLASPYFLFYCGLMVLFTYLFTYYHLRAFLELCDKVGGEVAQLGPMVDKAFKVLG